MKKQECRECEKTYSSICGRCANQERRITESNLYAAEYLLYAFHFEDMLRSREEHSSQAFMMMVVEG